MFNLLSKYVINGFEIYAFEVEEMSCLVLISELYIILAPSKNISLLAPMAV